MKKLFLLVASLFSLSAVSYAQEQGEDNGFGLRFHAGFYNSDNYGQPIVESNGGLFGNLMDDAMDAAMEEARKEYGLEDKKIPLLGMSIDNRWYVANPGKAGIAIDCRWLDFAIGKQSASMEGEEFWKSLNVHASLICPGIIGTFYLNDDMAIDAQYNIGATLAVKNAEWSDSEEDDSDLDDLGSLGSFANNAMNSLMSGFGYETGTTWGFGMSHFFGVSFRYKVFHAGVEANVARLKTVDWFDDDKDDNNNDSDNDDLYNAMNNAMNEAFGTVKTDKVKFNNFRVFLGFKF